MTLSAQGPLWLVGCGNMAGAMLRGWLAAGLDPAQVTVIDPYRPPICRKAWPRLPHRRPMARRRRPWCSRSSPSSSMPSPRRSPLRWSRGAADLDPRGRRDRLAARALARAARGDARHAQYGGVDRQGRDGLARRWPDPIAEERAAALMAPLGLVEWIADERLFDAVTALSGCGPAFLFRFIDALGEAGAALGLPRTRRRGLRSPRSRAPPLSRPDRTKARPYWPIVSPALAAPRARSQRARRRCRARRLKTDVLADLRAATWQWPSPSAEASRAAPEHPVLGGRHSPPSTSQNPVTEACPAST